MADDYPSDWDHRRKLVYQRDDYQCQNCGQRGGPRGNAELHAHHVVPKSKGGSHQLSNLTTVCSRCHEAIHGHPIGGTNTSKQSPSTKITEKYSPRDKDEYHATVHETIETYNILIDIFDHLENAIQSFDSLADATFNDPEAAQPETHHQATIYEIATVERQHARLSRRLRSTDDADHHEHVKEALDRIDEYLTILTDATEHLKTARRQGVTQPRINEHQERVEYLNKTYRNETWPAANTALRELKHEYAGARHNTNLNPPLALTNDPGTDALILGFNLFLVLTFLLFVAPSLALMDVWSRIIILAPLGYYIYLKAYPHL